MKTGAQNSDDCRLAGVKKLSHPLGPVTPHNNKGSKPAPKAPVSGVQNAVNTLKPIVKLPVLAAQASNTELRKP